MGILAEMALRRARGRLNSVQSRAAAKAPVKAEVGPTSSEVVVTGPINRFMYLEARKWAIDLVASLRGSPVEVVIERLAGATEGRPGSYVVGIQSVIGELQAGAGHD
ncbi:hypothetical protein [Pseudomonas guariconensis]|uniref:hypothetical protein n=1 Tax=Pseudomonas guariconensis TaxID=1288410 RepID=UPI0018A95EA5|nr:hypothetical protein [Pseudomonas guariconensis]MBF8728887.1 hypothetical protein [Pseudomonas guariconensis]